MAQGGRVLGEHGSLAELRNQRQEFGAGQWGDFEKEEVELTRSSRNLYRCSLKFLA